MKISFEHKCISYYKEVYHQNKRVQENTECVVPDVNEDIGKIVSVQSSLYLKSKDLTGRGVLVTGEAQAVLIYVTENEKSVNTLRLSKSFSVEYEIGETEGDTQTQVRLGIVNCEARILNPRKVSVLFDINGELSCYRQAEMPMETLLEEEAASKLHVREEKTEFSCIRAVCEKPFTFSEQVSFPAGKPEPKELVCQRAAFEINESQLVGTKLVVKGKLRLSVCYLSDQVDYPVKTEFTIPFSQILDSGGEELEHCNAYIEPSSCYCELVPAVNGEKALEAEIHAVLQAVLTVRREIRYLSDVYSNRMPALCETEREEIAIYSAPVQTKLIVDERLSLPEDCTDVLCAFPSLGQVELQEERLNATVTLDVLYRNRNDCLAVVRRLISLSGECGKQPDRLLWGRLTDLYLRPDSDSIDAHLAVEAQYLCNRSVTIDRVCGVTLEEDNAYDFSSFPAFTLVRTETEDLWELARNYHSSIKAIRRSNTEEQLAEGGLLLIPKEV